MSSRLDPLASTHTTPLESCVRRLDGQMRHPASIAFYLARYLGYELGVAYDAACRLQSRPDLDMLFNIGRNFIATATCRFMKRTLLLIILAFILPACSSPDWRSAPPDGPDTTQKRDADGKPNFGK
jgi:hypothetical protein